MANLTIEEEASSSGTFTELLARIVKLLQTTRKIESNGLSQHLISFTEDTPSVAIVFDSITSALRESKLPAEVEALQSAYEKITEKKEYGGLAIDTNQTALDPTSFEAILFQVEAYLTALSKKEASRQSLPVISTPAPGTKPMTLAEKIFAHHAVGEISQGGLSSGDVIRVGIDWVLASELSWNHMARIHESLGSPGIWRNDRFWLAGDHVAHPENASVPGVKAMIDASEKANRDFKMTDYQGMNYTIMHTEFVRERAEPGMLCIGSDSHTCSGGAVGCLSIGLGTADVTMGLALGETWFKVPESILIEFVGEPRIGTTGKDVIMYILKELKRNTVASERIVEFVGATQYLSSDARFSICNMCTEFGAVTGLFVPDEVTEEYISKRKRRRNKQNSVYFRPDKDAQYAGRYTIDLSEVQPSIAVYPEPDHVVPVSDQAGMHLDGVFIGACTTTEEELVLGALVLRAGLEAGLPRVKTGKRHYVPGSLPIVEKLKSLGLTDIYKAAGFTRGPPGCSLCLGLSAEKALSGETWLTSQNRNFKNRMGNGSFGHLSSAVVCAASSFSMKITDPDVLVQKLDYDFFKRYQGIAPSSISRTVNYVEPDLEMFKSRKARPAPPHAAYSSQPKEATKQSSIETITSKVINIGDFVDTDALAPGYALVSCKTPADFAQHVLEQTYPEFRSLVANGHQVVVAGEGMGVGSSREMAVSALSGAGVQCVIAKSFAFIYGRNQPSLGLLGITITDPHFYELAKDGEVISVDVDKREVRVGGESFGFNLSEIEYKMTVNGGIEDSFRVYGKSIWEELTRSGRGQGVPGELSEEEAVALVGSEEEKTEIEKKLEW